MAKIKTVKITNAQDAAKMVKEVTKVVANLGLAKFLVKPVKAPSAGWITANAPDGKMDIVLSADVKPVGGPIKISAVAGGQTSVLAVYSFDAEKAAVILANLKKCGLA